MKSIIFGVTLLTALKAVKKVWNMKCCILKLCTEFGMDLFRSKFSLWVPCDGGNPVNSSCTECGVVFDDIDIEKFKLSAPYTGKRRPITLQHPFCVGCFRFFGSLKSFLEKYKMLLWLISGECDENFASDDTIRSLQEGKYRKKSRNTGSRARGVSNVAPDSLNIATGRELMDLIVKNGPNDAILGHRLYLKNGSKFNSLTFDHIEPVATIKDDANAFSIDNIQLLSSCLNNVKDCYNDYELIFWLDNLLVSCIERYGSS